MKAPTDFSAVDIRVLVKGDRLSQEESNALFAAIHDALHNLNGMAGLFNMATEKPGRASTMRLHVTLNSGPWPWELTVPSDQIVDEDDDELDELEKYLPRGGIL
jgi:hypothetical protein